MVAERSRPNPGPEEVADDGGYSSRGSLPPSDREGASAHPHPFSPQIPGHADGSCDASGECTTDDSEDGPPTVSAKRDRKSPEWKKLFGKRRGRPGSVTELYKTKNPDVPLFAFNAEPSAGPGPDSPTKLNSSPPGSRRRRSRLAGSSVSSIPSERGPEGRKSSASTSSALEDGLRSPSSDFREEESHSDPGAPTTTEEASSVSDQAWDGYQDPLYLSESYSESTADQEEFRKVTEFGDDYDLSMEGSSRCFRCPEEVRIPTPPRSDEEGSYTDSDEEDFRYLIHQANAAWRVADGALSHTHRFPSCQKAELIATCRAHLRCLGSIHDHLRKGPESTPFLFTVRGLIEKWEIMEERVERVEEEEGRKPEEEEERMLRERLEELDGLVRERETEDDSPAASFQRLEEKIESLQVSLRALQETRERLLEVNLKVRRLNHPSLSEKVAESYGLWEGVYRRPSGLSETRPEEKEAEKKEPSLLRRILRVAVPVQLALVLLYCLARLLEPRCCDSVNNLHFSPAPQLRYVRGPPPL